MKMRPLLLWLRAVLGSPPPTRRRERWRLLYDHARSGSGSDPEPAWGAGEKRDTRVAEDAI